LSRNLIVESNFVLEIVLQQEQLQACDQVMQKCKQGSIKLVVPAYSILEPYETLARRHKARKNVHTDLGNELKQLSRSVSAANTRQASDDVLALLVDSANTETSRIAQVRGELLGLAEIVPLDESVIREAMQFQSTHALAPQDAIVYASVVAFLRTGPARRKCFRKSRCDGL
jgi:hypothetical protein